MMRDLINILDTVLQEATLSPGEITKYPERFDAFIAHIQNNKPFYTEKEGTEVVLAPTEAARFLKMKAAGEFQGSVKAVDTEGNQWPLSSFRKTAEFGGASAKPGTQEPGQVSKEGVLVKPAQIGITDQAIPADAFGDVIVNNPVLQSTDYGQAVIIMAQNIMAGNPAVFPDEIRKNDKLKKAIVDYAGEYLGVLALVYNQSKFASRDKFLAWLGTDMMNLVLSFPSEQNNPIADSFATVTNPENAHTLNISSKGTGGGAAPSVSSLKIPDHLRSKTQYQTAIDLIDLCQNENLPKPWTVSQVFQVMNLLNERIPDSIPADFKPFLPWSKDIVAQVSDSLKNGSSMHKYKPLFANLDSKGSDGGKLTYVTKAAVMNIVNSGAVPEFQAVVLEVLDYNFIQQYTTAAGNTLVFNTQWPAKLDGEVTIESKSGGVNPTKGGFSFKLKPKGSGSEPSMAPYDADAAAAGREPAHLDADDLDAVTQKRSGITARAGGVAEDEAEVVKPPRDNVPMFGRKRQR
jgi:hypothetical protein